MGLLYVSLGIHVNPLTEFLLTEGRVSDKVFVVKGGEPVKNRIKEVRLHLNMTQQDFAEKIGMKRNSIAQIELGARNPSGAVINNICKTFDVNEEWLRTGTGPMLLEPTRDEALQRWVGTVLKSEPDSFQRKVAEMMAVLTPEDWEYFADLAERMKKARTESGLSSVKDTVADAEAQYEDSLNSAPNMASSASNITDDTER